jgi:D-arginine dehydrogenase
MERFDFLVIGAGIAGASAAYELARFTRVGLLERESQPGYHSTGRSAALYSQAYGNAVIRALAVGGWEFLTNPPDGFAEHALLTPRGAMFVGEESQRDLLEQMAEEASNFVGSIKRLDGAEARALVPVLRRERVVGAVFEPHAMDMDVHALHHGFLRGFKAHGGRLVTNAELLGLARRDGGWVAETKAGTFAAPVVVNATGAWCDEVADLAGADRIGLVPKRRTVITFAPPPNVDIAHWPLTIGAAEDFYIKPDAGRLLGSPADETPVPPCDVQPEDWDIAVAVDRIQTVTDLEIPRIERKWAGLRSFVADKTPVVGFDQGAEGFFWLAGQGGYGIQTSAAMARTAAALARGGTVPDDLARLGVEEKSLSPARLQRAGRSSASEMT